MRESKRKAMARYIGLLGAVAFQVVFIWHILPLVGIDNPTPRIAITIGTPIVTALIMLGVGYAEIHKWL